MKDFIQILVPDARCFSTFHPFHYTTKSFYKLLLTLRLLRCVLRRIRDPYPNGWKTSKLRHCLALPLSVFSPMIPNAASLPAKLWSTLRKWMNCIKYIYICPIDLLSHTVLHVVAPYWCFLVQLNTVEPSFQKTCNASAVLLMKTTLLIYSRYNPRLSRNGRQAPVLARLPR